MNVLNKIPESILKGVRVCSIAIGLAILLLWPLSLWLFFGQNPVVSIAITLAWIVALS